jgi:hypothetical protein
VTERGLSPREAGVLAGDPWAGAIGTPEETTRLAESRSVAETRDATQAAFGGLAPLTESFEFWKGVSDGIAEFHVGALRTQRLRGLLDAYGWRADDRWGARLPPFRPPAGGHFALFVHEGSEFLPANTAKCL